MHQDHDGSSPQPTPAPAAVPDAGQPPSLPRILSAPTALFVTLAILFAPALVNLLLGFLQIPGNADGWMAVAIGVACVGSPIAGIIAGLRLGARLSRRPETRGVAMTLCALACVAVSFVSAFGGCVVGAVSRTNF